MKKLSIKTNSVRFIFLVFAALALGITACSPAKLSDKEQAENARAQALGCIQAQYDYDAKKWIDCLHPKVLEAQPGGREKLLKDMQEANAMTGVSKMTYDSLNVEAPKDVKNIGNIRAVVVPYRITSKSLDNKKSTTKEHLLGISEDEGKTWKFVIAYKEGIEILDKTFPGIKNIEIPKSEFN